MNDKPLAYALLRTGIGVNMVIHGMVRIPKLGAFSDWMVGQFGKTMLPAPLVKSFASALPFAEAAIGLLLILGLFTRHALIAAGLMIIALTFGSCLIENWEAAAFQLIYLIVFTALLALREAGNSISTDQFLSRKTKS